MKPKLHVVVASTRPGRVGIHVGKWFFEAAARHAGFDVELVDLVEVNLPFLDEPKHPRLGQYEHEHTKRWSAKVKEADAFVFVTPEYNYAMPAPLVNAIDFLSAEWAYKPVAFVGYGGPMAGARAIQMAKQLVTSVKMMPIPEGVSIAMVTQHVKDGVFTSHEAHEKAAVVALDELLKWTGALETLRV